MSSRQHDYLAALALSACLMSAPAAAAVPPAAHFFRNCEMHSATISPDGKHVLAGMSAPGQRASLVLVDLASMKPTMLARYADADVDTARWLGNARISFVLANVGRALSDTRAGLYAKDIGGGELAGLAQAIMPEPALGSWCGTALPNERSLIRPFPAKSDDMLVYSHDGERVTPVRMNTHNGSTKPLGAPPRAISWLFDDTDTVRVALTQTGQQQALHLRDDKNNWRQIATWAATSKAAIAPILYANKTLYVHARNGADRMAVHRYDLERAELEAAPLISSPDYDMDGRFSTLGTKPAGYSYLSDAQSTYWFDPALRAVQAEVDALFAGTNNVIDVGDAPASPYVLVRSSSPVQPLRFSIYNRATKLVTGLGSALPEVQPAQGAMPEMRRYKARDGLDIPVAVTLPRVAQPKNLPLIVLVKSNPWQRGALWGWDPEVQFLASRGYAVIQPETRGTSGFGQAFYAAGTRQWGRAMQDDLADGARWAVAQGIADPGRICIVGSGYGGYAALMGLVNDGALYRCGVSMGGFVDLEQTVTRGGVLGTSAVLSQLIGDPGADSALLRAASPLQQARRIVNPVFLAYKAQDTEVPLAHARALYDSLKAGNPAARLHVYDAQHESATIETQRIAMWSAIEQFLEQHSGKR